MIQRKDAFHKFSRMHLICRRQKQMKGKRYWNLKGVSAISVMK